MKRLPPILSWLLLAAAIIAYAACSIVPLAGYRTDNDFKHIYLGMKALLDGNSPYAIQSLHHQAALQGYTSIALNPYVYLPFTGYSMAFLAPFSLMQASQLWFLLNHIMAWLVVYILARQFHRHRLFAAALLLLYFAFSVPFLTTLSAGQLNLPQLLLMTIAFSQLQKKRDRSAGAILGLAAIYKLMPGIFMFYFLIRRKWQALGAMGLTAGALLMVSTVFTGPRISLEFFPVLQQMGYGKSTWPWANSFWDDPNNQSINSLLSHCFTISNHTTPWVVLGQQIANYLTVAATVALIALWVLTLKPFRAQVNPSTFTLSDEASYCCTLILGLLIPSLLWDHYLVMLILPAVWMINFCLTHKMRGTLTAILASLILTCIPWRFDDEHWRNGPGILLMSMKLWPTIALFFLSIYLVRTAKRIEKESPIDQAHGPV